MYIIYIIYINMRVRAHARARARAHTHTHTRCPILKVAPKYFFSETFSEKMFQTKVVWVEGGHKRISLIWPSVALLRSGQGHFEFFKWNSQFFDTYSCSLSQELFKTLY